VRTCVITGATSGIGRAVALALARRRYDLYLIGRNQKAGENVARACRRHNPGGRAEFLHADLAAQCDVSAVAKEIAARSRQLDVLINNAGARNDAYGEGPDGIERTFAANHLGHFLLTQLLRPLLESAAPGRVVTVASGAHMAADLSCGWMSPATRYDRRVAYANSKLANIVFARELALRSDHDRLVSNAVDPGVVFTRFARNNGLRAWMKHVLSHVVRGELVSAQTGADTVVHLAHSDEAGSVTGRYFRRRCEIAPSAQAQDSALGR
jgi:NAD(P)-dependent dehydrogenase (short-subunit alcohol dehydrogenase family)